MPWQQSPAASHLCAPSRMLRSILTGLVPVLIVALCHGANPRFTTIATYPSGGVAQYTASADVNGDGKQDVFASDLNGVISLLVGEWQRLFQSAKTLATLHRLAHIRSLRLISTVTANRTLQSSCRENHT